MQYGNEAESSIQRLLMVRRSVAAYKLVLTTKTSASFDGELGSERA